MLFRQIFDSRLAQYAYLVGCQRTGEALLIDPERDIDRYLEIAAAEGVSITAVTETHIHADFLSGAREFAHRHGAKVYLSDEGTADWKYQWGGEYDATLLKNGDRFRVGNVEIQAVHFPGHTPEHMAFLVYDLGSGVSDPLGLVSGDFVFVGDVGRPDLLESAAGQVGAMDPAARTLYHSLTDFLELPDYLQIWPGHGAGSACGKALGAVPMSTVGYERRHNPALDAVSQGEDAFVDEILHGQPEPPLYFARMKRLNKEGPPLLGELPVPRKLDAAELGDLAGRGDVAVLDTRTDRGAFMAGHLRGALHAPLDKSFPTVAGSYVEEDTPIHLIVDEGRCEEAVRELVRIGLDSVVGYAPPEMLSQVTLTRTETIDFSRLRELRSDPEIHVLDVRRKIEFDAGHVPDAQNIAHTRLLARKDEVPDGRRIAVHCQGGIRAAVAAALLERLGHEVLYVADHFGNWKTEESPTR